MRCLVTGGAGFIGSHIVDRLIHDGHQVIVYDNFSTGQEEFIEQHYGNKDFSLIRGDVLDLHLLTDSSKGCGIIFHLSANADVKGGIKNTEIDFQQNIVATKNVLEAMRINNIKKIVFASSAVVYGEPKIFPTPEDCELIQTSLYGASKLSGEAMIEAYCEYYGMKAWIFRFVSWIGERYTHGVIFDFMKKLSLNSEELEILGDGEQKKSYLYVKDGVDGIFYALEHFKDKVNIFNLGHKDHMNVIKVADIVCDELQLKDVKYKFTGGNRGWIGDSPFVHLDISKLEKAGWKPTTSIEAGIKKTVMYLKERRKLLEKRKSSTREDFEV
ncbi:MAG: NAD-dependent epimerase/dehydratase family protein [Candidatus Woesearchaeota archaeon]